MKSRVNKYYYLLLITHWLVLLAVVAVGWSGYRYFARLPWTEVQVYADCQQITKTELRELVVDQLQRGMLGDSLAKFRERLAGNPWVKRARITRRWPGILQLDIVERQLTAVWLDKDLVDSEGKRVPMSLAKQPLPALPHLFGSEQRFRYVLDSYRQLLPILDEQGWQLTSMEWHQGNYWRLRLAMGTELLFIDKNLVQQFTRFARLYPQILQQQGDVPQYIDFRYRNGNFAVK